MKEKIFGIGLNKTGTTSIGYYFEQLGYKHKCAPGYKNIYNAKNKINKIYKIVDKFEFFEDWPWPLIYKELYYKYPKSKFILTIRKNAEEWFYSLLRHSKLKPKTQQRLAVYGYYDPNESNKIAHKTVYNKHNRDVINFFKENNPDRLLILSTDDLNKEEKIYKFIGKSFDKNNFIKYPHKNNHKNKNKKK
jgi:hypothetical protein